jgi:hypothetical protein
MASPQHASEIRQAYGYREFADPGAQWRLLRWLYALCWTGTDRPSVLFDQATAWLVTLTEFVPKSWERRVIRNGIVDRHIRLWQAYILVREPGGRGLPKNFGSTPCTPPVAL